MRCWLAGLLLALALALPGAAAAQASADADARARELYENGAILYEEGRYEDAIRAWQEAWALSERPLLLYNIANAQERVGQWAEALETLNRYRVYAKADERDRLDRRIANLERRLASEQPPQTRPDPEPIAPETHQRFSWAPVTLFTAGAALAGSGTIFALRAGSARDELDQDCVLGEPGLLCPATSADTLQRDRVSSWVADGAFVLGGAALLGGTLVVVLDQGPVRVRPLGTGLVVQGSF